MQCLLHWIMFQQGNGYNESKHKVSSDFFYRYTVHVLHQHLRYVTIMDRKSIKVTSRKACLKLFTLDVVQPYWSASLTNWESEPARAKLLQKIKNYQILILEFDSTNQITLHCSFIVLILIPNYFFHYTVNLYCVLKMHNFVIFEIRYLAKHNKSALFTHLSKHSINKWAFWSSRRSSHFVPHVWLHNISTRPSAGHFPPTSRISKLKNLK